MFISKVTLKRGPELFKLLKRKNGSDGYVVHQLLWALFPNDGDKKRDFLFHMDGRDGIPQFLLVSETEPVETKGISVVAKPYSPKLTRGQRLAFSLVANPVVSRKNKEKKHSVKHDVWMDAKKQAKDNGLTEELRVKACEDASKEWLIRQGERCGFSLEQNSLLVDGYLQNRLFKKGKSKPIRYSSIHYEGVLTVSDPEKLRQSLFRGLGPSKAFGCGLMLVKSV